MNENTERSQQKPLVLITGAAGNLGGALRQRLTDDYRVVGLDLQEDEDIFAFDITDEESVRSAMEQVRSQHGDHLAAVIHLAAYFDFSGEDSPLYEKVNVEGTRNLLRALQGFRVDRFIYSGTMLVHRPSSPGIPITQRPAGICASPLTGSPGAGRSPLQSTGAG